MAVAAATAQAQPNEKWPRLFAVDLTAALLALVRYFFHRCEPMVRDEGGNVILTNKQNHNLYWIPMEYWTLIVALVGTILVYRT